MTGARFVAETCTPLGGECSSMTFFQPSASFLAAMEAFRGLDIIDVGAGRGQVTSALKARGHDVVAIDIRPDGAETKVHCANAVTFSYPPGAVGLFCRPCHSDYFVEPAIERMLECDVSAVVYVSMAKIDSVDLGRYRRYFRRAETNVSAAGETFYLWMRRS
jgi:hypothetical protein